MTELKLKYVKDEVHIMYDGDAFILNKEDISKISLHSESVKIDNGYLVLQFNGIVELKYEYNKLSMENQVRKEEWVILEKKDWINALLDHRKRRYLSLQIEVEDVVTL